MINLIPCYSVMPEVIIKSKFLMTSMAILSEQGLINSCRILVLKDHSLHEAWHKLVCRQLWLDLIYSLQQESHCNHHLHFKVQSLQGFLPWILLISTQVESAAVLWLVATLLQFHCIWKVSRAYLLCGIMSLLRHAEIIDPNQATIHYIYWLIRTLRCNK